MVTEKGHHSFRFDPCTVHLTFTTLFMLPPGRFFGGKNEGFSLQHQGSRSAITEPKQGMRPMQVAVKQIGYIHCRSSLQKKKNPTNEECKEGEGQTEVKQERADPLNGKAV